MKKILQKLALWAVGKTHPNCTVALHPKNGQGESTIVFCEGVGSVKVTTYEGGGAGGDDLAITPANND